MKRFRAFLIDPANRTITPTIVDAPPDDDTLNALYRLIGCNRVTAIELDPFTCDTLWIDDDGLMQDEINHFFSVGGFQQALAGKGVVLGADLSSGDSRDVQMDAARLARNVVFYEMADAVFAAAYPATAPTQRNPLPVDISFPPIAETFE